MELELTLIYRWIVLIQKITYKKGNVMFCCSRCNSLKNGSTKAMWIRFLEIDKENMELF
jgi:hypothetical protein